MMSKRVKEWRKRLGEFDGGDQWVVEAYRSYILDSRIADVLAELENRNTMEALIECALIEPGIHPNDPRWVAGKTLQDAIDSVIDAWMTDHRWWTEFTGAVMSEIEYQEQQYAG